MFYQQMQSTGRKLDMIYAGTENGVFWGYFNDGTMTYRGPGRSTAANMSWAPYAFDKINDLVLAGKLRAGPFTWQQPLLKNARPFHRKGPAKQFASKNCSALTTAEASHARKTGWKCNDLDFRSYFTADGKGHSKAFYRWRTYDPRVRPWYKQAKSWHAANSSLEKCWSDPYEYDDGAMGITAMGIVPKPGDSKTLYSVLAVDYELRSISKFLKKEFAHTELI